MIPVSTLRKAEHYLAMQDGRLLQLIEAHGHCTLGRTPLEPFHVLCSSIIGQQLSVKAAAAIQQRLAAAVLSGNPQSITFKPAHFLDAPKGALRRAGLSDAKVRWLLALAQTVESGQLDFSALRRMPDTEALFTLDTLPGIGRWTAEMFLIFALDRLDIFSMGDAGLRRTVDRLYNSGKKLDEQGTTNITARWAPYRSIASWYLWHMVDGESWIWA